MITVTAKAAEQIHQAAAQSEAEGMFLRIAARRGMDGAIQYGMGFDEQSEEDMMVNSEGVTVIVSPDNLNLLNGAVLDFVELDPGDFRFIFINPNDDGGSSCSTSSSGAGGGGGCGGCGGGCH
ncbi:MAG: iron-sulfur cluster assembly accessory protein [Gammaproteobacteria bacterium]|nr:iron-sulfur cluster assembly accessory protein [Gammaproteobacteria bacterium]MBU1979524.1 iron-sulfur cluster assembly accessory protein [Gammaproteobacteria bacterium]